MATTPPPASAQRSGVRLHRFWQRVTEGLELTQLWSQFETEARTSYRLYSRDVAAKTPDGLTRRGHNLHVVKEFFWAVLEKLSPARRVLLLAALDHAGHSAQRIQLSRCRTRRSTSVEFDLPLLGRASAFSAARCWRLPTAS